MKNIPLSGPQLNKRAESGKSDDFANKCKFYLILANFSNQSGREINPQSSTVKTKLSALEVLFPLFRNVFSKSTMT